MAKFAVTMQRMVVEPHPNADRLEVARVLGYTCVVPKGEFRTGDVAAYIPEQSIVPDAILEEMGLTGRLAGKDHNRVRAARLRGILSQGLLYAGGALDGAAEGDDVTEALGIIKYEPPIPAAFSGRLERYGGGEKMVSYDVENVKKYPGRIAEGEHVTMCEKIHGTLCYVVCENGTVSVSSKGRASAQLVFAGEADNVYTRMADRYGDDLEAVAERLGPKPVHILCEAYGSKCQDLHYGTQLDMRVFDILVDGRYLEQAEISDTLKGLKLKQVPLIYDGPFSQDVMEQHTSGPSVVDGADNIREGVVVRPVPEREDMEGRVMLKSVSPKYLCRGGNVTEFN